MPKFYLVGDILHAGTIQVEADSVRAAIAKAEAGDFVVDDEQGKTLGFTFDGTVQDENGNEIDPSDWDTFLHAEPVPTTQEAPSEEPRKYAGVEWTADDVAERLGIPVWDAEAWLQDHGRALRDRLIELGYEVIDALND